MFHLILCPLLLLPGSTPYRKSVMAFFVPLLPGMPSLLASPAPRSRFCPLFSKRPPPPCCLYLRPFHCRPRNYCLIVLSKSFFSTPEHEKNFPPSPFLSPTSSSLASKGFQWELPLVLSLLRNGDPLIETFQPTVQLVALVFYYFISPFPHRPRLFPTPFVFRHFPPQTEVFSKPISILIEATSRTPPPPSQLFAFFYLVAHLSIDLTIAPDTDAIFSFRAFPCIRRFFHFPIFLAPLALVQYCTCSFSILRADPSVGSRGIPIHARPVGSLKSGPSRPCPQITEDLCLQP